jgi:hypothetical protein
MGLRLQTKRARSSQYRWGMEPRSVRRAPVLRRGVGGRAGLGRQRAATNMRTQLPVSSAAHPTSASSPPPRGDCAHIPIRSLHHQPLRNSILFGPRPCAGTKAPPSSSLAHPIFASAHVCLPPPSRRRVPSRALGEGWCPAPAHPPQAEKPERTRSETPSAASWCMNKSWPAPQTDLIIVWSHCGVEGCSEGRGAGHISSSAP